MLVKVIETGSDGNCNLLQYKNTTILIDAGFATKKKSEFLLDDILAKYKIDGIIITHDHRDHWSEWTGRLSIKYHIPIYLSKLNYMTENNRTSKRMSFVNKREGKEYEAKAVIINANEEFKIGDLLIKPVKIHHDATSTFAYIFNETDLAYVSDCGIINNKLKEELLKVDNLMLEFNYDEELTINSDRHWTNKLRNIGQLGHLSNQEAIRFLEYVYKKHNKEYKNLITLHISNSANTPETVTKRIEDFKQKYNISTKYIVANRENNDYVSLE